MVCPLQALYQQDVESLQRSRARREAARLRSRFWRVLPRSLTKLVVAVAFTWLVFTLAMAVAFVVACVLSLV